jgi:predicted RNA-binding protein with PUA-like domain
MYWLFQCNPEYFRIIDALAEEPSITWPVRQHRARIGVGDRVVVWVSRSPSIRAGAYATGLVTEIKSGEADSRFWVYRRRTGPAHPWARVQIDKPVPTAPLLRESVIRDAVLKNMAVIRSARGTNFALTADEWQRMSMLLNEPRGAPQLMSP